MRVVVAFARFHYLCRESVERYAPHAEVVDTSSDPGAYPRLFASLWKARRSVLLIEQDVEIHDRVVPELSELPRDLVRF